MKVIPKRSEAVIFEDVSIGEAFSFENVVYMKIKPVKAPNCRCNAINLEVAEIVGFSDDTEVFPIEGAFVCRRW